MWTWQSCKISGSSHIHTQTSWEPGANGFAIQPWSSLFTPSSLGSCLNTTILKNWHPALWLTEVFWVWEVTSGSAWWHALLVYRKSSYQKQRPLWTSLGWANYSKHSIGSKSNHWVLSVFSHFFPLERIHMNCSPILKFTPSHSMLTFIFCVFLLLNINHSNVK